MKKLFGLLALLVFAGLPAKAQLTTPRLEVGGGYTFRSFAPAPTGEPGASQSVPRVNMNGWDVNATFNINNWLGITGDVDGTRNSVADSQVTGNDITWIYTVMAGPRLYPLGHHKLTPFAQVLLGHAYFKVTVPSGVPQPSTFTLTDGSFAWSAGGGVDWTVSKHFAVRLGEFDYERTAFSQIASAGLSDVNNDFKFKAGVIFRF